GASSAPRSTVSSAVPGHTETAASNPSASSFLNLLTSHDSSTCVGPCSSTSAANVLGQASRTVLPLSDTRVRTCFTWCHLLAGSAGGHPPERTPGGTHFTLGANRRNKSISRHA